MEDTAIRKAKSYQVFVLFWEYMTSCMNLDKSFIRQDFMKLLILIINFQLIIAR